MLDQQILDMMKVRGAIIPAQIAKDIHKDLMMTSAILSELSSKKKVKVSHLKIGGTPLYYLEGQEAQLQKFSDRLDPKEKTAFTLLSQQKIAREEELNPVMKFLMRKIKDFAIPLEVTYNNQTEIFWKWYLLPNDDAELMIKQKLGLLPRPKPASMMGEALTQKPIPPVMPKPQPRPAPRPVQRPMPVPVPKIIQRAPEQKPKPVEVSTPESVAAPDVAPQQSLAVLPEAPPSSLLGQMKSFFEGKQIKVVLYIPPQKKSEEECIIHIPTPVGMLAYLCVGHAKKTLGEAEITSAFAKGQLRKLPVLLLSKAKASKKVTERLEKDFKSITLSAF